MDSFLKFSMAYISAVLGNEVISYRFIFMGKWYWVNVSIYDYHVIVYNRKERRVNNPLLSYLIKNSFLKSGIVDEHISNCVKIATDGYDESLDRYAMLMERAIREKRLAVKPINNVNDLRHLEDIVIDSLERDVSMETSEIMSKIGLNISPSTIYGVSMYGGKASPFLENDSEFCDSKSYSSTEKEIIEELERFAESIKE